MILENADQKIAQFNDTGLHYNLVASQIYNKRKDTNPFEEDFLPYIIAGLLSFDMGRMMGKGKYEIEGTGFGSRLNSKLQHAKPLLEPLINANLIEIDLQQYKDAIIKVYESLSANGQGALNEDKQKHFHVGTTKIMHFLNPELFIIVDSNAAKAFRMSHNVQFKKGTQPGYSADKYIKCMECAQKDIQTYELKRFQALEPSVPIARIYDKLTFVTGSGWPPQVI